MKKLFVLASSILLLASCDFKQNPIDGLDEALRKGREESQSKPQSVKPLPKEFLQIDAPKDLKTRVGSAVSFMISGRVMEKGISYKISIDNLASLKGATFDSKTGEFAWTPTKNQTQGLPYVVIPVEITMITDRTTQYDATMEQATVLITVYNDFTKPIINSIEQRTKDLPILVGRSYVFDMILDDQDSNASQISLIPQNCSRSRSLAAFIKPGAIVADPTVPGKFNATFNLDLYDAESLPGGSYCFAVVTRNAAGIMSNPVEKNVEIQPKIRSTVMSLKQLPPIVLGDTVRFNFTVFDPSMFGTLSLVSVDDISKQLPGSQISCENGSDKYMLLCKGLIVTSAATPRTYTVNMTVGNAIGTLQSTNTNHSFNFEVKAITP